MKFRGWWVRSNEREPTPYPSKEGNYKNKHPFWEGLLNFGYFPPLCVAERGIKGVSS